MLNLRDFAIDMEYVEINFKQMKNAITVAVKAALSSAVIIAEQVLDQNKSKQIHVKSDSIDITVGHETAMITTKDHTFVSGIDTIKSMEFELVNFSFSQLTELLDSLVKLGKKLQKGNVEFETEDFSRIMFLSNTLLKMYGENLLKST